MKTFAHSNGDATFSLTKRELKALSTFASSDETRPNLNGVQFEIHDDGKTRTARATSTDGHRLLTATGYVQQSDGLATVKKSLVPRFLIEQAAKLASKKGQRVEITPNCTKVAIVGVEYPSGAIQDARGVPLGGRFDGDLTTSATFPPKEDPV